MVKSFRRNRGSARGFLSILFIALLLVGCSTEPDVLSLQLTANRYEVYSGDTVQVRLRTSSSRSQKTQVGWTASAGIILEEGPDGVLWIAPEQPGTYRVQATVTPQLGSSVIGETEITVKDAVVVPEGTLVEAHLLPGFRSNDVGELLPVQVQGALVIDGIRIVADRAHGIAEVMESKGNSATIALRYIQLTSGSWQAVHGTASSAPLEAGTQIVGRFDSPVSVPVYAGQTVLSAGGARFKVDSFACLGIYATDYADVGLTFHADGIRVDELITDSVLRSTDLRIGDRIAGVLVAGDQYSVAMVDDLNRVIRTLSPGDEVVLLVRNLIRQADIKVRLGECFAVL